MEKMNVTFILVTGSVKVQLFDKDGNLKQSHEDHNLVVTAGKNYLAAWLQADSQAGKFMPYIGLGTGITPPASGDTSLQAELSGGGYSRQSGVLTNSTNTWTNTTTFPPGVGTGVLTEAGVFSASTGGTMFSHIIFAPETKNAGDTLVIVWTVTFN